MRSAPITPTSQWNANPSLRGVGTVTLIPPSGAPVDLIQNRAIRSGTIAAYLQMRDQDLVQAQNQLDALAAGMARRCLTRPPRARRYLRRRKTASTSILAACRRQYNYRQLHRHRDEHAAYDNAGPGRRSRRLAARQYRDRDGKRHRIRHRFLRRHRLGRCADQHRAHRNRHGGVEPVRDNA